MGLSSRRCLLLFGGQHLMHQADVVSGVWGGLVSTTIQEPLDEGE